MAIKIKRWAWVCAAAALSASAQAAVVTLDFESIGIAAPSTGTAVGSTFTASDGVTFGPNAIANHNGKSDGNDVVPPPARSGSFGYVRNAFDSRTGAPGEFSVSFSATKTYADISLDWSAADDFQVTLFDTIGMTKTFQGNGSSFAGWAFLDLTGIFGDHRRIDHINFSSGTSRRFAIDNLRLASSSGTVPEPAGLGLVALALAGAGLASQRNRKA